MEASRAALENSLIGRGESCRDADKQERQRGAESDSRSTQPHEHGDAEQHANAGSASGKPDMQVNNNVDLNNNQRTAGADSATAGTVPLPETSQRTVDSSSASSESLTRRAADSGSRGSRPKARAAKHAQIGQKHYSTSQRAPPESKATAPRSRKGADT